MSKLKYVRNAFAAVACATLIAASTFSFCTMASDTAAEGTVSAASETGQNPISATVTCNGQSSNLFLNGNLGNEDSEKILGDSWYYGIVADDFTFNGEAETNFAVKHFSNPSGNGGQTGVTDKGKGSLMAFFVVGSMDDPFKIKGISADVTAPEKEWGKFTNSTDNGGTVQFHDLSEGEIDTYIDELRNDAREESERLAALDSVKDYSNLPQNQMVIDITQAGQQTVYLNVDAWEGLRNMLTQSSGIKIKKNPGQKIVFNYPTSTSVTTQKIVIIQNDQEHDTTELANKSTQDINIAPDIIFNMPKAETVTLNDDTGIFLAPNAEVQCYGVDAGWVNCRSIKNYCEWHFINGNLPEKRVLGARRPKPQASVTSSEQPTSSESKATSSEQSTSSESKATSSEQPTTSETKATSSEQSTTSESKATSSEESTSSETQVTSSEESTSSESTVTESVAETGASTKTINGGSEESKSTVSGNNAGGKSGGNSKGAGDTVSKNGAGGNSSSDSKGGGNTDTKGGESKDKSKNSTSQDVNKKTGENSTSSEESIKPRIVKSVQTGDNTHLEIYEAVSLGAAIVLILGYIFRRRSSDKEE